ncbi:uncharacterized protein LOC116265034 [Nymphaea colorata]|uniref:uncharacterized protein LOC116265034 n=1 Tax=Nymphaea colorata TaxID=210225 RepID=UPI00129D5EC1|nr:uncharacterized protein LOC116265034 [Nymphaea colorata]XP_031501412.1 uncharacterized protein LOC116265034 [Nymphaea colorata]XP_031501414.1 uncharacterized protein LOC116265034 [Nymphaea colorata]
MVDTVEATENGVAAPVRIGTTGTIGSLMIRELESMKVAQKTADRPRKSTPTTPVSVLCGSTPKKAPAKKTLPTEPGTSSSSSSGGCNGVAAKSSRASQKTTRNNQLKTEHQIPMLDSENGIIDKQCCRKMTDKKTSTSGSGSYIVEVVDVKCGGTDKIWSGPITSLKKLGFSKLSDTS